jgi:hypothetical protein
VVAIEELEIAAIEGPDEEWKLLVGWRGMAALLDDCQLTEEEKRQAESGEVDR